MGGPKTKEENLKSDKKFRSYPGSNRSLQKTDYVKSKSAVLTTTLYNPYSLIVSRKLIYNNVDFSLFRIKLGLTTTSFVDFESSAKFHDLNSGNMLLCIQFYLSSSYESVTRKIEKVMIIRKL